MRSTILLLRTSPKSSTDMATNLPFAIRHGTLEYDYIVFFPHVQAATETAALQRHPECFRDNSVFFHGLGRGGGGAGPGSGSSEVRKHKVPSWASGIDLRGCATCPRIRGEDSFL